jgi:spermidine synthase
MTIILQEPWGEGFSILCRLDRVHVWKQTAHQDLLIADTTTYGRSLFLDELIQSTQADEALYHEPFVHPALVIHGAPRDVLVGGAGEGATLREILRHASVLRVVAVDLDAEVVEACKTHLPEWSAGAFDDPRVELRIESIQDTLRNTADASYDAVLLDITDPVEDGPAVELFTTAFFGEVARVLRPGGIVALQSGEIDPYDLQMARSVRSTLLEVFGWVKFMHLHVPSFHGIWSVALAAKSALEHDPADLAARVGKLAGLKVYTPVAHRALLELPPYLQAELERPGKVITGADADRHVSFRRTPT